MKLQPINKQMPGINPTDSPIPQQVMSEPGKVKMGQFLVSNRRIATIGKLHQQIGQKRRG